MTTRFQSQYQVKVGDVVTLTNSAYRAKDIGTGLVVKVTERGSTVEVTESTSPIYRAGMKVRFNLNTWTDMLILQERGKPVGCGITAAPEATRG